MEAEHWDFMGLMIDELRRDELLSFPDQSIEWDGDNSQYGMGQNGSTTTNEVLPSGWAVGVRSAYYVYQTVLSKIIDFLESLNWKSCEYGGCV